MRGRRPQYRGGEGVERRLDIVTIGKFSLNISGTPLRIISRKANALIGYLAISDTVEETRERLVGLLWSETPEENARASLRQILHEIRGVFRAFGFNGLRTEKRVIALDRNLLNVDLHEIVEMANVGRVHRHFADLSRLPDMLLADFVDLDPAFRIWLLAKRQALHDRLIRTLETAMRTMQSSSPQYEQVAQAIMSVDPTHEEACRNLIRSRAGRGDFGGALRLYKTLWDLLEEEFDVEPSTETQKLIVEVRNAAASPAPASQREPIAPAAVTLLDPPPAPVVVATSNLVLNIGDFDASATRPDQRYIVSGFRHELVASLVRFREWRVRDDPQTRATPAESSGHEYQIAASAMTTPNDIRLILTLREAQTGTYVWSDQYRITLANWVEAQQAIVRRIAVGLNIHLSASRLSRLSNEPIISPHIYDRWLRAQVMIKKFNQHDWMQAAKIFRTTISEAPSFSPAYSSLAQINTSVHFVHPGVFRTREREREALDFARQAVQLDPIDSRAQLALGWAHAMSGGYSNAEIHMGLAIELNENDPWTAASAALFHGFVADYDKARELIAYANRLAINPTPTQWVYASTIHYLRGDYDECVVASLNSGDAIWTNVAWRAAARARLGQSKLARDELRHFIDGLRPQWKTESPATDANIIRWLLHLYPIMDKLEWEHLRTGLADAGAPVEGIGHAMW